MSKVVRRVLSASLLLLLCAGGSCYVGERQWESEVRQEEEATSASGFYISDTPTDMNLWQVSGSILFCAGVSVAVAGLMLWMRDRRDRGRFDSHGAA